MSGELSDRERRVLDEVEEALRRDRRLSRRVGRWRRRQRLRRMRPPWTVTYLPRARTLVLLNGVTVVLLAVGIGTGATGVVWAFSVVWPLALLAVLRRLCRWYRP
ncbi:hypothetical protein GCM10009801_36840 [Streptomyces albiaxialis]|uniref:DUF3040 domain-containing protein n=1 Tax=Streptomyces albiaxialis TaxID=329523 RepID=A0ABP5HLM8_9ACTN